MSTTRNLRLNKPNFNLPLWHDEVNDNFEIIDAAITTYLTITGIVGAWENGTAYEVGNKVIDTDTSTLFECAVDHTSSASPATFAEDRQEFPTYWAAPAIVARGLGAWTPATPYEPNDFVIGTGNIFAVCISPHTSSGSFAADVAYWDYLLDLSTLGSLPAFSGGQAGYFLRVNLAATVAEWISPASVRSELGLGTLALQDANNVNINGGAIAGITDLAIADGGTGASDAASAFAALKQAASDTVTGVVELATQTEVNAGSDATRVITPATRAGAPRFSASKSSGTQTATSGAAVTVTYNTENIDVGGFFATNTWTPPAGYVFLNASLALDGTNGVDQELLILAIAKNAGLIKRSFVRRSGTASVIINVSGVDLANGTDAYTVTFQKAGAGNGNIDGTGSDTFFEGFSF